MAMNNCEDCLDDCQNEGSHVVTDRNFPGVWLYCDEHLPSNDPGVVEVDDNAM